MPMQFMPKKVRKPALAGPKQMNVTPMGQGPAPVPTGQAQPGMMQKPSKMSRYAAYLKRLQAGPGNG